jgi:hypothetical protein
MKNVTIHNGTNSAGTMFIYEKHIDGEIVKENAKSIRVHMTHCKCTTNGKITREYDMNETTTFAFWKTIENRQFGKNTGKKVSLYKNNVYGIIEIAE